MSDSPNGSATGSGQSTASPAVGAVPHFVEGTVEADGFRIRYMEAGRGEPLVVLHGAGGLRVSRSHQLLAQDFRVILVEAPGFGRSAPNTRSTSAADLADTLARAATALGLDRFNLMGTSFGGLVALWLAVRAPERIAALVLVAPAAIRLEGQSAVGVSPEERRGLLYAHPERQPPMAPLDPRVAEQQDALVARLHGPPRDPELEEQMRSLRVPVLALFGTRDRVVPPETGRLYRSLLPSCHVVLVYDAAHALDADRPEAFAAITRDFLERHEEFIVKRESELLFP